VQEALTNASRHSNAQIVSVILEGDDGRVRVTIEDDGVGFDVENVMSSPPENRRLGLMSMQERVQMVGGEFSIRSVPRQGTTVHAIIPILNGGPARETIR